MSSRSRRRGPYRVLVVDPQPEFTDRLLQCTAEATPIEVEHVPTCAAARTHLETRRVDLAVIEPRLPDGDGLKLAEQIACRDKPTQAVVITESPSLEAAVAAMQAGAIDYLGKWMEPNVLHQRIQSALTRQSRSRLQAQRLRRLRRLVRKLNQARVDVSKQVDLLCTDLVSAYHELAIQMQQVSAGAGGTEYAGRIGDELDLEQILRKTLEYLIEKAGPTNAAVFLPANMDEYTLGGYVNYDHAAESADMLLDHLADVMAPKLSAATAPVHITDNEALKQWIGDDAAYLADSHVLAFACRAESESLAVVVLFRDGQEPFPANVVEQCTGIAAHLGSRLAKVIRIHHRHMPDLNETDD